MASSTTEAKVARMPPLEAVLALLADKRVALVMRGRVETEARRATLGRGDREEQQEEARGKQEPAAQAVKGEQPVRQESEVKEGLVEEQERQELEAAQAKEGQQEALDRRVTRAQGGAGSCTALPVRRAAG